MRKLRYRRYFLWAVVALWTLAMAGCDQKTINDIRAEPSRYANKQVTIVGTVTSSYSVLGKGAYEIEDGTGKLWIVSDKGVPREGAKVGVKGTIRDGYNLGSLIKLPEAVSSGLVMIESSHKAR
ncbi:MAG: OB-fold nucleic acid binding domain-containing protein [Acidobacteria bacterium]|nr:OB-fold nucleic acid binding domain-containing protein [Acidobacteriota bacterium]